MALTSYTIKFFAWCNEGTSDKIWGYVEFHNAPEADPKKSWWQPPQPGSVYNFWGARGKSLRFKRHFGAYEYSDLRRLAEKKLYPSGDKAPYREVKSQDIEKVYPGFAETFENQLLAAKWDNAVKNDDTEHHTFI